MKHPHAARTAAIAATLLAAGLATAGPAAAAEAHSSTQSASRITSQEQLRAGILHASGIENTICSAGVTLGVHPMGGYPPPIGTGS